MKVKELIKQLSWLDTELVVKEYFAENGDCAYIVSCKNDAGNAKRTSKSESRNNG